MDDSNTYMSTTSAIVDCLISEAVLSGLKSVNSSKCVSINYLTSCVHVVATHIDYDKLAGIGTLWSLLMVKASWSNWTLQSFRIDCEIGT